VTHVPKLAGETTCLTLTHRRIQVSASDEQQRKYSSFTGALVLQVEIIHLCQFLHLRINFFVIVAVCNFCCFL